MKMLFTRHFVFYLLLVMGAGGFGAFYYLNTQTQSDIHKPTERVAQATVAVSVKASGKVEAEKDKQSSWSPTRRSTRSTATASSAWRMGKL